MKPNPLPSSVSTRNHGIDALRILSMFMALILHILGKGGILDNAAASASTFIAAWTLEAAAFCAVNCYGLISGYVGIRSRYKYTNIVILWLQVALYSVLGTLIFYLANPGSVTRLRLISSLFPVSMNYFWYFSAYVGLYLLIPGLNLMVNQLTRRQAKAICIGIVILFSCISTAMNSFSFSMHGGYSFIWLVLLYILGACIRKHDFGRNTKTVTLIFLYLFSVLVSVFFKWYAPKNPDSFLCTYMNGDSLICYTSPTILLCGICLLILFSRLSRFSAPAVRLISWFSPLAFGVYIIHIQEHIQYFIFEPDRFARFTKYHPVLMVGTVLLSAVVIFTACAFIDWIRLFLFQKLKIKQRLLKLEDKYVGDLWNRSE